MVEKKKVPELWRNQIENGFNAALKSAVRHDGSKGYFLGIRIHHGLLGGGVVLLGLKFDVPYLIGYGFGLMVDDFDDIFQWLDFEKGGDPNKFISFEK